jgi:hypothetical protein
MPTRDPGNRIAVPEKSEAPRLAGLGGAHLEKPLLIAFLGNPLPVLVHLVLLLDGAPAHPVSAVLLTVLLLGGVVRCPVDLTRVIGQVPLYAVWQIV